jgi:uncharacterized protein (TIGR02391 family)
MSAAIVKIDRRIADLEAFDVESISDRGDARIHALENKLDELLVSTFGAGTLEYERYHYPVAKLDRAGFSSLYYTVELSEVIEGLVKGKASALAQLTAIKEGFLENLEDAGLSSAGRALRAYDGLELQEDVDDAAAALFRDGHYAEAVEAAVKALNQLVRLRSGVEDKDGTQLMESVFSPNNPVLKFNSLSDQSDKDEQKGFMMMFSGAISGLRNPRAHKLIKDDPERALEFIAFISLLAKLAKSAKK